MKLIVLGSGASVPQSDRTSSAFWLDTGGGTILLDCAPTAAHRMAAEGCDWAALDAIWISHFHLDHCGGLAPFLFGMKHAPEVSGRTKPLRIFGPVGLAKLIDAFNSVNNYRLREQRFEIELIEIQPGQDFEPIDGLSAITFSTPHTPESSAIKLEKRGGGSLVFTSDTGCSADLARFARTVDLLLIECTFPAKKPVQKHLEIDDVLQIVRVSKPGKAVLTHLYPDWDGVDIDVILAALREECEVLLSADGMRLSIP